MTFWGVAGAGSGERGGEAGELQQGGHHPVLPHQGQVRTELHIHLAQAAGGDQPSSTG